MPSFVIPAKAGIQDPIRIKLCLASPRYRVRCDAMMDEQMENDEGTRFRETLSRRSIREGHARDGMRQPVFVPNA
jgi:hypothetical protein